MVIFGGIGENCYRSGFVDILITDEFQSRTLNLSDIRRVEEMKREEELQTKIGAMTPKTRSKMMELIKSSKEKSFEEITKKIEEELSKEEISKINSGSEPSLVWNRKRINSQPLKGFVSFLPLPNAFSFKDAKKFHNGKKKKNRRDRAKSSAALLQIVNENPKN